MAFGSRADGNAKGLLETLVTVAHGLSLCRIVAEEVAPNFNASQVKILNFEKVAAVETRWQPSTVIGNLNFERASVRNRWPHNGVLGG